MKEKRGEAASARRVDLQATWLNRPLAAQLLGRTIFTTVLGAALVSVVLLLLGHQRSALLSGGMGIFVAALWVLQKRGHIRVASVTISSALLAIAGYAMVTSRGLNDSSIVVIPGVFLLVSILLGPRWLLLFSFAASIILTTVAYFEIQGRYVQTAPPPLDWGDLFEVLVVVWILAAVSHFLITALAQAFQDEKWARDSARALFNATDDAIFVHDAKSGKIIDVNEAMLRMYRCSLEEAKGATIEMLSSCEPPYTPEDAIGSMARAISEGPQAFIWHARRLSGELFWAEVSLRFETVMGEPRVLAVVRDISDRRELDQRVHEAERMSAVGLLAGGVAHDFNNQLMGIMGNAEFLRGAARDPALRKAAEAVLHSSERAADLTKKLLAFARRGRDQVVLLDIHRLIEEVSDLVGRSIDKRIVIERDLNAERAVVMGDPSALQNALLNLTLNARDAMNQGGTLSFETRVEPKGALSENPEVDCLKLSVSDTGEGMSEEIRKRVFEPFFTTKDKGSGMGLAAVYGTVRDHGGEIRLESTLGKGTRFDVILPLSEGTPSPSVRPPPREGTRGEGRILLVDDEDVVLQVVQATLKKNGYEVDAHQSGADALNSFEPGVFALAILDITMPGMDGIELLTRLRERDPELRAFFISGHASDALRDRLRKFDGIRVLSKPFSLADLIRVTREEVS